VTLTALLLPLPALLPLVVAFLLLGLSHWLPPRTGDITALIAAVAVTLLGVYLAREGLATATPHWFGGWTPASAGRPGVTLGISFAADPASAALVAFAALLFAATFVFAWGLFDQTHCHFHILMLLFLGAIAGFCLTEDLFNLFVWFELMSVAAFALTAYPLGKSSLEGALNFTITNALGSFLMLSGVGLLYARTGTLDMNTMAGSVRHLGPEPVLVAGFCLISVALLIKGAIVPFHLWLADAHAVAPSPVSVLFSGCMVSVALFALAKLSARVFLPDAAFAPLLHGFFGSVGVATAVAGAVLAWAQRHLKRLLAFSTISHMGLVVAGLASMSAPGLAGMLLYIVGHGLIKGSLFMVAGMLMALRGSPDELTLYGRGSGLGWAGAAMIGAGLLFCDAPLGVLHAGSTLIEDADPNHAMRWVLRLAAALTGAAVLRAGARIFLRWSGAPGPELTGPTEREHERAQRPLWVMVLPCLALLGLALLPPGKLAQFFMHAGSRLLGETGDAAPPSLASGSSWIATMLWALAVLALALLRSRPLSVVARRLARGEQRLFGALQALHSGLVGDYVAWIVLGLAALALSSLFGA
jgi:multicomponent Na+:H+ antiporter subunit D